MLGTIWAHCRIPLLLMLLGPALVVTAFGLGNVFSSEQASAPLLAVMLGGLGLFFVGANWLCLRLSRGGAFQPGERILRVVLVLAASAPAFALAAFFGSAVEDSDPLWMLSPFLLGPALVSLPFVAWAMWRLAIGARG